MIGLVILAALAIYAIISMIVILVVAFWAKRKGRRPLRWAIGTALVMYHLVFWDFIPTLVVYKYYCATKAGFWVYKTPEQWKAENPGVAETLTWSNTAVRHYVAPGITGGQYLNERIVWIIKVTHTSLIPIGLTENLIVDAKKNEILVRQISVGAGTPGTEFTRFWTHLEPYTPNNNESVIIRSAYRTLGSEVK